MSSINEASEPPRVVILPEPNLCFAHGQAVQDPRDGLTLFGPLPDGAPHGIRAGVIGTRDGIAYFKQWVSRIQGRLADSGSPVARPIFPGFEAAFRIPWRAEPVAAIEIPGSEIESVVNTDDRHQRVHSTVGLFTSRLLAAQKDDDAKPDVWFVVIPDKIYELCRPNSNVPTATRTKSATKLNPRVAKKLLHAPSLFSAENEAAVAYQFDVDFHDQLKARLLPLMIATQVLRESTIFPVDGIPDDARPSTDNRNFQAAIAWNVGTAAFYKAGGRPWRIDGVREGVCYLGLVFKKDDRAADPKAACCAAQMFLDSGDGIVFKGAVGPWYSGKMGDFQLSRPVAADLVRVAMESYSKKMGKPPTELFIHGRSEFADEMWRGFCDAVDSSRTNVVGVTIRSSNDLKVFRAGTRPVIRGTAVIRHKHSAFLWTSGFIPRLATYVGREVPNPLRIDIKRGSADIEVVLRDILALTKLNYNTCMFSDGLPVTLRFSDSVGEILTAGPTTTGNPLPFRYYI